MGGMLAVSLVIRNPAFFKGMVLEVDMRRPFPFRVSKIPSEIEGAPLLKL